MNGWPAVALREADSQKRRVTLCVESTPVTRIQSGALGSSPQRAHNPTCRPRPNERTAPPRSGRADPPRAHRGLVTFIPSCAVRSSGSDFSFGSLDLQAEPLLQGVGIRCPRRNAVPIRRVKSRMRPARR